MAKIIIPKKKIGTFNSFIRDVVNKNPQIAGALNQRKEQRQFYRELKKYENGGITKQDMREVAGKFWYGSNDYITKSEARDVAKQYVKSGKKYIKPKEENIARIDNQHGKVFYGERYGSKNKTRSDNSLNNGHENSINKDKNDENGGKKHKNIYDALYDIKNTKP